VAKVEQYVRGVASRLIDSVLERFPERQCDFVQEIAAPMPLHIICEMMGIPAGDEAQIFRWTNTILGGGDPEYGGTLEALMADATAMFQYAQALGQSRLDHPTDDLTTLLMHAEVDGERLSTQEFGSFFILLVVAGNETTRNAISHGMKLLTDNPDQRQRWWSDPDTYTRGAVEEIVRYATPVIHFRRTTTADTEIRGVPLPKGTKVVLWYNSANRDEDVFDDPHRFDITRDPTKQVGFGAGGPHFCLGANLARREIAVMFDEIRRRMPTLEVTGEPAYLQSFFINGIKRLPCAW
jgi:cytochrome P450